MTEKTKKAVLAILLIGIMVLGIININLNNRISNLEMTIQSTRNYLSSDIQGLYSMQQDILDKIDSMNEKAAQNAKLSFDEAAFIKSYNADTSSVDVDISFYLKQFGADDIVNITARGISGKVYDAAATRSGAGMFTAAMTLPAQDNYSLSFTASGASSISGELTKLNLADELCERFKFSFGTGQTSYSNQQKIIIMLYPEFSNNTQGNAALKISELYLLVESGSQVVGTWDLLPYLQDEANIQTVRNYWERLQIASGEISAQNDEHMPQNLIEFTMPDAGATTRLVIIDNMGVRYEQTDIVYAGSSPNSGAGGSVWYSSVPARIIENGNHGDGYIYMLY